MPAAEPEPRPGFPSPGWWLRDRGGRVVLAQPPNPPLLVWLAAVAVSWSGVLGAAGSATAATVGVGASLAWALDELLRGDAPVRRLLGAVVLAWQLARLLG